MKVAFLTELTFQGKVLSDNVNMRTEFAWMHALDADHFNIVLFEQIRDYDHVFIIFPKGSVFLNSIGSKLVEDKNPTSPLIRSNIIIKLKENNKKVHFVQEGPHWLWNDYEIYDQVYYYNMIAACDSIFCHNEHDTVYYKGMFPNKPVNAIHTLMIHDLIKNITSVKEEKTIIGGNMARWYGGFESYIVAQEFELPIWGQTSHAIRDGEEQIINHLPRISWIDWMKQLSSFKYAVHLMPTVAAGTFSLNCAYFGIPCIGNINVDTQQLCHPYLSVDEHDVEKARNLANKLISDKDFYILCSNTAKENYKKFYNKEMFEKTIMNILIL